MADVKRDKIAIVVNGTLFLVLGASWLSHYLPNFVIPILIMSGLVSIAASVYAFEIRRRHDDEDTTKSSDPEVASFFQSGVVVKSQTDIGKSLPRPLEYIVEDADHNDTYWKIIDQIPKERLLRGKGTGIITQDLGLTLKIVNVYLMENKVGMQDRPYHYKGDFSSAPELSDNRFVQQSNLVH